MPPPPYRADQVGSLIRPKYLLDARAAFKQWLETDEKDHRRESDDTDVKKTAKKAEQKAVAEAVSKQVKRGITPITSGEFERPIFYGGFFEALEGVEMRFADWTRFRTDFPTNRPLIKWSIPGREVGVGTGKIKHNDSAYLNDWLYVRSLLPEERWKDVKVTVPPPGWWHVQLKDGNAYAPGVYDSDDEFLSDMSGAVRKEIMILYDHGVRFIQIDDPNLTFFCDEAFTEEQAKEGVDLDALLDPHIKSHNDVLKDLPADLKIGVHLCRGNFPGGVFLSSGSYERIAGKLFRELNYELFYLEYDSNRAGDFKPLKHLPADKAVVLGVVTTKSSEMENIDDLKARMFEAADIIAESRGVSREEALQSNLAVSPQCGFASASEGTGVGMSESIQWQKLELLKHLAESVWPGS